MSIRSSSKACLSAFALILLSTAFGSAADSAIEQLVDRVRDLFEQNKNAVVRVVAKDRYGKLCGTGFFTDPSGTVYTSTAIVDGAMEVEVHRGNKIYPARILVSDPRSGVAILKVDAQTPFLPARGASSPKLADPVLAIGYPMDLPPSPTFGIVAGFDRTYPGGYFSTTHFRANLPVQEGQGGSPVLNLDGQVVGMVVSCLNGGTGCYILPIEAIDKVRSDFMRFGDVKPGWIGVHVEDAKQTAKGASTARIVEFDTDCPACSSGLQLGDIILQIGKSKITSAEDILDASYFLTAGDVTPITVLRNGRELTVHVSPGIHPSVRETAQTANILNFFVGGLPTDHHPAQ